MNDDDVIARLRAGLETLTATITDGPPPLASDRRGVLLGDAGRVDSEPRTRRWLAVAATTLVVAMGAGVWLAGRSHDRAADTNGPPVTTPVTTPTTTPTTESMLPVPPVPDGWEIVEWGSVRLAVPQQWHMFDGACATGLETATTTFTIVCDGTPDDSRPVTISITERNATRDEGSVDGSLNGLATLEPRSTPCPESTESAGCTTHRQIQALGVEIGIEVPTGLEPLADQLWSTVTASGRWRAANLPTPPVPDDWIEIEYEGLAVSIPPRWPVRELGEGEPGAETCATGFARPEVVTGADELFDTMRCPAIAAIGVQRAADGLRILPAHSVDLFELAPGWPVTTRQLTSHGDYPTDLSVYVGFGDDPTIGAAILGSIHPACAPYCTAQTG